MEKRALGQTDMQVSVLGFGGAEIGFEGAPAETVSRLLTDALDAGLNVIDTAECYIDSEELIGQAASGRRKDFHLFSKCGHPGGMGTEDWTREGLLKSIQRSLKRLRTDRLDLIQLHSCSDDELRKGEVIEALEEARRRGYARYIGYSGDGQAARSSPSRAADSTCCKPPSASPTRRRSTERCRLPANAISASSPSGQSPTPSGGVRTSRTTPITYRTGSGSRNSSTISRGPAGRRRFPPHCVSR